MEGEEAPASKTSSGEASRSISTKISSSIQWKEERSSYGSRGEKARTTLSAASDSVMSCSFMEATRRSWIWSEVGGK